MQSTDDPEKDKKHRQWTSRSLGSSFQHKIFYTLISIGGRRLAYFVLYFVVSYYMLFRPSARKKTEYYLSHRFPGLNFMEMFIASYRLSLEFGKILLDRAIIGILGPERMHVKFDGKEELLKLVKEGKGIIIVAGHVGCWQVAMSALHFINIPVSMHMQKEEGDVDRHYFEHAGMESPYRIIDPWGYLGGALEMVEVLKRGEILCVMGDRLFGNVNNAVEVDFLGERSLFPFSAYKVASATGAPIVVLFSYKTGVNSYELTFEKVIRVPEGVGRSGEKFIPYVSQFVESLDAFTKEHPYQFFNFYDMWDQNLR